MFVQIRIVSQIGMTLAQGFLMRISKSSYRVSQEKLRERIHYSHTAAYGEQIPEEQSVCINDLCVIQSEAKNEVI